MGSAHRGRRRASLEVHAVRSNGDRLVSGDVDRAGDSFELRARPNLDSHAYVVYENSLGESAILPEAGRSTFVPGGSWAELPLPGYESVVDDQAGRAEVIYVLATQEPVDPAALSPTALQTRYKPRGLGVRQKAVVSPDGSAFHGDLQAVVEGYGGVLYSLVLDHR